MAPAKSALLYVAPQGTIVEVGVKRLSMEGSREKLFLRTTNPRSQNNPIPVIPYNLGSDKYGIVQGPYYPVLIPAEEPIILTIERIIDSAAFMQSCRTALKITPNINKIYVVSTSLNCNSYVDSYPLNGASYQKTN